MIDSVALGMVPSDMTGFFRRLNGAAMYDILDTLDALPTQKNIYPNPDVYSSQLNAAGIGVGRMKVAMAAVLAKRAGQTSYDSFSAVWADELNKLPQDQRANIATYFTGVKSTDGLTDQQRKVAQYTEWARLAVLRTRKLLDRGAGNRDFSIGATVGLIEARWNDSGNPYEHAASIAARAIAARGGNCDEFSATAYMELQKMGARPIFWCRLVGADHAFVLVGEGPPGGIIIDESDLQKWGKSVVVCDAWAESWFLASSIPFRLPACPKPFKAMPQEAVM